MIPHLFLDVEEIGLLHEKCFERRASMGFHFEGRVALPEDLPKSCEGDPFFALVVGYLKIGFP